MAEFTLQEESPKSVEKKPSAWAKRWSAEFESARKFLDKWQKKDAKAAQDAYEDDRADHTTEQKANFFWANVTTQSALMYSRVPQVVVDRQFADHSDDAARVAGPLILNRLLNGDIQKPNDGFCRALKNSLRDYRVVGYGFARVRYEAEFDAQKTKTSENVATDYIYWEDQLYSPCRTFEGMRWWAFKTPMDRDAIVARFGEDLAKKIPYDATALDAKSEDDLATASPWNRAWVWEIWDKSEKAVYWYVEGYPETLDRKDDPYGLTGFFPFPEPMMANLSTSAFRPVPDHAKVRDLYDEVNRLQTRIGLLERALRVAGVYDQEFGVLEELVSPNAENKLIPVPGWTKFREKGGLDEVIAFMPIREISEVLVNLRGQQREAQQILYELTGQSDLMRGQVMKGGATATESAAKVRYGSVRIQDTQDRFAEFATGLQQLRAELITKLFDDKTILQKANAKYLQEAPEVLMEAIRLLRTEFPAYRIIIRSETMAAQDFAAMKQDRVEVLQAAANVMAATAPLVQSAGPLASIVGLSLLKWSIAGMRGAAEIEGVFDKMIEQATQMAAQAMQNPQGQRPDPKTMAAQAKTASDQMKVQADFQKQEREHQMKLAEMEAEAQLTERQQVIQRVQNVQEAREIATVKQGAAQQRAFMKGGM